MKKTKKALSLGLLLATSALTSPYLHQNACFALPSDVETISNLDDHTEDQNKSAEELIAEAQALLTDERPLDARTKLLKALNKEPQNFKPHMLLGGYYMMHVGHFRLALSYLKQAERLFEKKNGKPPFEDYSLKDDHARILYLLAETKLNLDNYRGALTALDEYAKYYSGGWYPGSRAWVLMKLGRVQEATRIARLGILMGAEPGRTLNILGILLSMQNQREESLRVFNEAINYEYSLGSSGQPATPLNNSGEVYREIFREDRAEGSWLRAVGLPDGCEHVLPSLNLANMYIEQLRFDRANWAMNNFEECNRQFPLRNGEEHRALVHMARGRIALHTGDIKSALSHLESATERQQWFGKIGTNPNDLKAATTLSLAQALRAANNHLDLKSTDSAVEWAANQKTKIYNSVRAWWLIRRARQVLSEDLKDFEDIYIRSTDSMLEYHTLGDILEAFPTKVLLDKINQKMDSESRPEANNYYYGYLAQNYLAHGETSQGLTMVDETISSLRADTDDGLKAHLLGLKIKYTSDKINEYKESSINLYKIAPAELINKGGKLPVRISGLSDDIKKIVESGPFIEDDSSEYSISNSEYNNQLIISLTSNLSSGVNEGRGETIKEAFENLLSVAFREKI